MAEIKIERKKTGWIWLVVGLIIVALLAYFFVFNNDKDDNNPEVLTEAEYVSSTNETVAAYVSFIENSNKNMSLDHVYTNEALLKLVDATKAKANEVGYEVGADLEKVKEYANMITEDAYATSHADYIRKSDDIITIELQNIQQAKYPNLADDAKELKTAAESVNPDVLTLDQKEAVKNFFAKAADILKKMN